jgi:hypothetical protein
VAPVKRHKVRAQPKKDAALVNSRSVVGNPDLAGGLVRPVKPTLSGASVSNSHTSPTFVKLVLVAALALALLVVGLAFVPERVLPRSFLLRVDGHHDDLVFGGIATAVSIGFGLVIVFLLS